MKIVHSWADVKSSNTKENKFFLVMTLLSVLSAKKTFGNIHLVTNERGKKLFEELEFPYDSITTELEGKKFQHGSYAMGKLYAYVAQDKPFLHIDNDTFLFESRLVGNSYPITFSFPDINQPLNMKAWEMANKTYFDTYTKLKHLFDEEFFYRTRFDVVPNACIFGGHNLRYIKDTYNQILQIYEENTDELSSLKYSSALLEQGLFFPMLSLLFEEVTASKRWINDNSFIWSQSQPLQIEFGEVLIHGQKLLQINERERTFPGGSKTKFYDNKLKILIDNWFGGFLHLGGFREDVVFQWIVFEKLKKYYDYKKCYNNICKKYKDEEKWETNIFGTII